MKNVDLGRTFEELKEEINSVVRNQNLTYFGGNARENMGQFNGMKLHRRIGRKKNGFNRFGTNIQSGVSLAWVAMIVIRNQTLQESKEAHLENGRFGRQKTVGT